MSALAIACVFVSSAALVALLARLATLVTRSGWKVFGSATESELASLYIFISARQLRLITAIFLVAATGLGLILRFAWPTWLLTIGVSAIVPHALIYLLRSRRRSLVAQQLPDALTLWAGLLRSGQSLSQALGQVAARQAPPLRDDLGMLLRQHRVGMPLERAIEEWHGRVEIVDLGMVSTLLRTSRELGGNLAESLARLADVMRSRMVMEARIRALTSQGKLQGLIVGLLPLLLLVVLGFMEPEAMRRLYQTHAGWATLATILALEATGFVLIRRIVSIDV